jgi:hypothetical protein
VSRSAILFVAILAVGCQGDPIDGAWKIVSMSYAASDTTWTVANPQPSLYLFANQYYSVMYVPGDRPRVQWASMVGTDSEKVAAFDTFMGHSGSFKTKAGTVTVSPIVSKIPNTMVAGVAQTYAYTVRNDTLTITLNQNRAEMRTVLRRLQRPAP